MASRYKKISGAQGRAGYVEPVPEVSPCVVMDAQGREVGVLVRRAPLKRRGWPKRRAPETRTGAAWRQYKAPRGRIGGTPYRRALIKDAAERWRAKREAGR